MAGNKIFQASFDDQEQLQAQEPIGGESPQRPPAYDSGHMNEELKRTNVKHTKTIKTNFYFPAKLIKEAKLYCIKHDTTLTALMNNLLEDFLHAEK